MQTGCKKGLSFLVAMSVVLSLVPAPALAEAVKEAPSSLVGTTQVGGSQAQPAGQPEGQGSGGETSHGEPAKPTEVEGATPAESDPTREGGESPPAADLGLAVQGDGDGQPNREYTPFSLGRSVDYSLGSGESLWGSFTAPEAGLYDFTAHCTSFAPAVLRIHNSDEDEITNQTAYNAEYYGGTEAPATITRYMSQGEQLLLSVSAVIEGDQVEGSVMVQASNRDTHDLALASLQLEKSQFTLPDDTIEFVATLTDCMGNQVDESNYDLVFYTQDESGNWSLCEVPSGAGSYSVEARAKEGDAGGGYSGQTDKYSVEINDPASLSSPWWNTGFLDADGSTSDLFETSYTGEPIQIPQVKVWREGNNGEEIALNQGTDFIVSVDGDVQSIKDVGEYSLRVSGTGSYSGTIQTWLRVYVTGNDFDLSQGQLELYQNSYHMSDDPVSISCSVFAWNNGWVGDESYDLVFYDAADATQPLSSVPSEAGTYWVAARGNGSEQEGYFGETPKVQFEIIGQNHIASWDCSLSPDTFGYDGEPITWPTPSFYRYDDGERIDLQEDTDFRLVGYGDVNGNPIDTNNPPSAIGPYWADYQGIGSYTGTTRLYFSIVDPKDISTSYWSSDYEEYSYTGQPVSLSKSQIYRDDDGGQKVVLREGEDYEVSAYYSDLNPDVPLAGAPIEPGDYRVQYVSKGEYSGTRDVGFRIVDASDLSEGYIELAGSTFAIGESISAKVTVRNSMGDVLTEGTDYELVYYESDGTTPLNAAPTEAGSYAVAARAMEGTVYTGETSRSYFELRAMPEGIVNIENDQDYFATIAQEGSEWIGRFVAPASASYEFYSTGDADTYGGLYRDPLKDDWLGWDSASGEGENFRVVRYVEQGETAYLFVGSEVHDSAAFPVQTTVHVRTANNKDLANGSIQMVGSSTYEYNGNPIEPEVYVLDSLRQELTKGTDYELVYYAYAWDETGRYGYKELVGAPTDGGQYGVAARAKTGNDAGYTGTTEITNFYIDDLWGISTNVDCEIAGKDFQDEDRHVPGVFHTGTALTPQVSVHSYQIDADLVEGTDYTVTYANNMDVTSDGEFATATIEGIGKYHGTVVLKFVIADPHDLQAYVWAAGATLTASEVERPYVQNQPIPIFRATGELVKPTVNVNQYDQYEDIAAPVMGTDFTVSYEQTWAGGGLSYVGEYEVVLTASEGGRFAGVASVPYEVTYNMPLPYVNATPRLNGVPAANVSIESRGRNEWLYTLNNYEGELTGLSWSLDSDDGTLVEGTDYKVLVEEEWGGSGEVCYCFQGIGGYSMQLYAYVRRGNATNIDGAEVGVITPQTYTGTALMPELTVSYNDTPLQKDVDYAVLYQDNVNAGTATITITGMGDYYGTKTVEFSIVPATIAATDVFGVAAIATFTGSPITMPVEVIVNSNTLQLQDLSDPTKGDYTIAYENNVNAGTATVTITGKNNYAGTVTKSFTINPVEIDSDAVELTGVTDKEYTGAALKQDDLALTLGNYTLAKDRDYTVEYANNVNKGQATMTIAAKPKDNGGSGNFTGSRTQTFYITGKVLTDQNATVSSIDPVTYDGTAKTPELTVTLKEGNRVLEKGTDYEFSYADNTNAGIATVTIAGKGDFDGTLTREFTISPATITASMIEDIDDQTYTGENIEPNPVVRFGDQTLSKGIDYTMSYISNVHVGGSATAIVTGKGNFTGSVDKTFVIQAAQITSIDAIDSQTYTGNPITPAPVVRSGDNVLQQGTDYDVAYANNTNAGTATVTATGKGDYTGTKTANFQIVKPIIAAANVFGVTESATFTGSAITMPVEVVVNGKTLQPQDLSDPTKGDYKVVYEDNTDAGTAKVTVTGMNNYDGTVTKEFAINPVAIDSDAVALAGVENKEYTGSAIDQDGLALTLGDYTLAKGTDYTVAYANNINAGTATATVTGKGNFTGSRDASFTIVPATITSVEDIADQTYTGAPITPAVTVKAGDHVLDASKGDYLLTYSNNTNVGTATVTIVGSANYTGTLTKSFVIAPATISSVEAVGEHEYTGSAIEPELVVKAGSLTLGPNDYVATFSDNTNAGSNASVSVAAVAGGNFAGSKDATFAITRREIGNATIDAFPDQVYTGSSLTPELTLFDNGRALVKDVDYEIAYADNTNVTATGQFASITITGKGNYTGTKPSGFSIAPRSIARATVTAGAQTYTGGALTPDVTVKLGDKTLDESDYDVAYSDNVNAGTATVTVTGKGNYTDAAKGTFQIRPASIADATIARIDAQVFTGKAIEPEVMVSLGDKELVAGDDYAVSYKNNVNADWATATVMGVGNYTDSVSSIFRIDRVPIDSNDVIVSGIVDKTANGSEQTQDALTLRFGDYTLTSDDYTVEYENNVAAGEATITIRATVGGGFTGTRTEHFRLTQLTMGEVAAATYTGEAITPKPAIKDGETALEEGTDFEYGYANNTDAGVATVTVTGKGTYAGTTMSAQFTINPASITEVAVADGAIYDGTAKTSEPTVKAGETTLTKGTDYTVAYRNNVNAGTASVVVAGTGNYGGTRGATFSIAGASIADATIEDIAEQTYTGKDVKPAVVVKLAGKTLVEGTDYTVVYANNRDAGTATVTVAGAGNYTGEKTADFTIAKKSVGDAQISAISDQTYTGDAIEPAFTVVLGGKALVKDVDYTVAYENNINAGDEAKATVTGMGNYAGSVSRQFTIKALDLADATIDGLTSFDADGKAKFAYTGEPITPEVTVSLGGKTLAKDTDYELACDNNEQAGQALVTISAIGANSNYVGELTAPFTIVPATITEVALKGNAGYAYTGEAIKPELVVRAGERTLNDGDYTVTYLNNVNAGGATATVTGKRNYTGTASVTFNIVAANAEGLFIDAIADQAYAGGGEIKPSPTVKFDGKVVDAQSYDVAYANNTGVGVATATITPKAGSNFTGARTVMFNIVPATIDSVTGVKSKVEYTGEPVTFSDLTVKAGDRTLDADDYTVSYANNVNVGTARLTIAAKGNYAGGGTYEFQITPKSIANYTVELPKNADGTDVIYTETVGLDAFEPVPVVKDAGGKVLDPANYDVTYRNNSVAGEASVVVTGKGNYKDSPEYATFTIYKFAGTAASDGENAVIWHVEGGGAMTIEPKKKDEDATLGSASSLTWSQAVADYTTSVSVDSNVKGCTDTSGMFSGLANLTSVDVSEFDTSEVTNMSGMFQGCESLTAGDVTGTLDTSGVTDMSNMFAGCTSLESLDFAQPVQQQGLLQTMGRLFLGTQSDGGFDTSKVTDMSGMFQGCTSLTGAGLKERLNTANVTNMSNMFAGCTGLTDLDLDGINTASVTDMSGMFRGCTGLRTLNVASFDTGAVTSMVGMFDGCALRQFTIGASYMNAGITEALPEPGASTGMWWATDAQAWRSNDAIRSLPTQAAGTYSSTGLLSAGSTSIASANIEAATTNPYIYNGSEHKPVVDGVTIGQGQDQVPLVVGIDYEVGYQANQNAGTAQVVVTGIGDYSSSASRNFTIQSKSLEDNTIEVTAPADVTYNGKEQKNKPTVRSSEKPAATLVEGTDYTLSWQNNVNAGTATITVTGKGNYAGTKPTTFKINKAASSISLADQTLAYTGEARSYSGKVTNSGSGGRVTYAYYSDAACSKSVDASNVKAAGTYYVRATLAADANYNAATSAAARLTIAAKTFPDVPASAWYANVVSRATGLGLMSGYADGSFGPNDKITRGQVAVVLWNMAGSPAAGSGARTFPDVDAKAYFYNAVRWASSRGVVSGYANGRFGPNDNVTREQLAAMLANYAKSVAGRPASGSASDYAAMSDRDKVSIWAQASVGWCFRSGILSGSGGRVLPQGNATRAEAAKMVVGLHDLLA